MEFCMKAEQLTQWFDRGRTGLRPVPTVPDRFLTDHAFWAIRAFIHNLACSGEKTDDTV